MVASLRLRNPLQDGRGSHCISRDYRPLHFYPRIHNEAIILERREYYFWFQDQKYVKIIFFSKSSQFQCVKIEFYSQVFFLILERCETANSVVDMQLDL